MTTIKDVAKYANVSTATVSRYFRSRNLLTAATQQKIEEAIRAVGYTPNSLASMLKSSRTNTVGLLINDISNIFFNYLIRSLNEELDKIGKRIIVLYPKSDNISQEIATLLSLRVEAIVFIPTQYSPDTEALLAKSHCYPLQIFVDFYPKFDSFTVDDALGAELAVREFAAYGHKKIMLIDSENPIFGKRKEGMTRALQKAGLPCSEENFLVLHETDCIDKQRRIAEAIKNFSPTAILSVTNNVTQNVASVLRHTGNDRLSLIMYDDSEWAQLNELTTISHPFIEMTQIIQSALFKNLSHGMRSDVPIKQSIQPVLVRRKSVIPPQ